MDVEVIVTNGDGPDVDAVISGSVQFAVSTPNRLFTAFEQGKPLKAVMMLAKRMSIECAMNKQVADRLGITPQTPLDTRLKAMKGLTVAGTRPGAFTYVLLEIYGKRVGPRAAEGLPADRRRRRQLHAAGAREQPDRDRLHRQSVRRAGGVARQVDPLHQQHGRRRSRPSTISCSSSSMRGRTSSRATAKRCAVSCAPSSLR